MKLRDSSAMWSQYPRFAVSVLGLGMIALAAPPAHAQVARNVELLGQVPGGGNDCWGYVSPSGREYALKGTSGATVFIEITDPRNPVTLGQVAHSGCTWSDIRTYDHYAYVVTECGSGIQVIDLGNIDSGVVTLTRTISSPSSSHNVVIDTDSGFMYLAGGAIFDLSDPANPVRVGTGSGWHDAQVVTYTSGQYAGREIMFAFAGGSGMGIVDVTNKSNPFLISLSGYPSLSFSHQGWTEDLQYIYVDDESSPSRTIVFDISDLSNPVHVNTFTNGLASTNHNLFIKDGFIFEANYTSGLRVFDACDPANPIEVGFYDTFPANNNSGFSGAWGVYPFFPSGTVIVNDGSAGLFIVDPSAALAVGGGVLSFDYPNGRPELIDPSGGTTMRVEVSFAAACTIRPQPGTGMLHYDTGAGFVSIPMQTVSPNVYDAVFPAVECPTVISYYVSAETTTGVLFTDPPGAPGVSHQAVSATGITLLFHDNFEQNTGWTAENLGATTGDWERGVPVNDPTWPYDPISDSDGSGQCFLTENTLGNTDVDDGAVRLTSPTLDMSAGGVTISYDYFLNMTNPAGVDRLLVEINSNNGVGAWTEIVRHETSGGLGWRTHKITEADLLAAGVTLTSTMR
ncbi:MAG: choice-of-anchor B family protein, partial [Planctomycetes bacterium]|nr:choice-of-anchor B family protein [Planctomycetota bacterium]